MRIFNAAAEPVLHFIDQKKYLKRGCCICAKLLNLLRITTAEEAFHTKCASFFYRDCQQSVEYIV
jgi:hypothetical protein